MAVRFPEGRGDYPTDLPGSPEAILFPVDERQMFKRDELAQPSGQSMRRFDG
jgi:hypothetical protein